MNVSMKGKVVLITGGSAGIGYAAARLFALAGASVTIAARSVERGRKAEQRLCAEGGDVRFVRADVSESAEIEELVKGVVERFGRLDYGCNNAAVLIKTANLAAYEEADFDREVALNLKSVWLCMKHELAQMQRQEPRGGSIVNVSSVNGLGGVAGAGLYAMAKAGVLALTKSAAQEYGREGIRVNALVPGGFDTEMLQGAVATISKGDPQTIQEMLAGYAARVPLGRIGNPDEAAEAILWLCSSAASYVTGQSMIVDGGLTAWAR